jgi:hypothetical protein
MRTERATRASWKTKPMPEAKQPLHVEKIYSAVAYSGIARGMIPAEMEDKWFMFLEDDWLYLHRSWSGNLIYQVRFEPTSDEYRIAEVWVNRDPSQYTETNEEYEAALLLTLIDWLVHPE